MSDWTPYSIASEHHQSNASTPSLPLADPQTCHSTQVGNQIPIPFEHINPPYQDPSYTFQLSHQPIIVPEHVAIESPTDQFLSLNPQPFLNPSPSPHGLAQHIPSPHDIHTPPPSCDLVSPQNQSFTPSPGIIAPPLNSPDQSIQSVYAYSDPTSHSPHILNPQNSQHVLNPSHQDVLIPPTIQPVINTRSTPSPSKQSHLISSQMTYGQSPSFPLTYSHLSSLAPSEWSSEVPISQIDAHPQCMHQNQPPNVQAIQTPPLVVSQADSSTIQPCFSWSGNPPILQSHSQPLQQISDMYQRSSPLTHTPLSPPTFTSPGQWLPISGYSYEEATHSNPQYPVQLQTTHQYDNDPISSQWTNLDPHQNLLPESVGVLQYPQPIIQQSRFCPVHHVHVTLPSQQTQVADSIHSANIATQTSSHSARQGPTQCVMDYNDYIRNKVFTPADIKRLKSFAEHFKEQRLKFRYTQADVAHQVSIRYGFSLCEGRVALFESGSLYGHEMASIKSHLELWLMDTARTRGFSESQLKELSQWLSGSKKGKRHRTSIDSMQKKLLEREFRDNYKPSTTQLNDIAIRVGIDRAVVRTWFCNRRQKHKADFGKSSIYDDDDEEDINISEQEPGSPSNSQDDPKSSQ